MLEACESTCMYTYQIIYNIIKTLLDTNNTYGVVIIKLKLNYNTMLAF